MQLPPNRLAILILLWAYSILRNAQIRDRLFPNDLSGAITRGHMRKLVAAELVRKYQPKIVDPLGNGVTPPVYTLTLKGGSVLAAITGDPKYLIKSEISFASWMTVNHWVSVSSLAMLLDDTFVGVDYVRMTARHFEHEVIEAGATDPSKKYLLHTKLTEKLFFCPDMGIETESKGHRRAWFIEYETGSDTPARVAAKKHKGVAGLTMELVRKIFPHARDFRVLAFCPNAGWRDSLRKEFKGKPGSLHWLFCATPEVKVETFLHEPLLYTVENGPFPFMPRPTVPLRAEEPSEVASEEGQSLEALTQR